MMGNTNRLTVRVLNTRGVGFITYTNESNAQFAKEAMAHQSLDHSEILNVRWATADPNPMAQKREARRIEEQAAEAIRRALPAEFIAELEGRDPEARKRKKIEGGFGLDGYSAPDDIYYARGENAVTDAGRRGFGDGGLEEQQRLMLEASADEVEQLQQQTFAEDSKQDEDGIFSKSTLAALQSAKGTISQQPKAKAPSGPLVAYDSDSD